MQNIAKIPKNYLIAIAGSVWMFAGVMVCSIGYPLLAKNFSVISALGGFAVFILFYWKIFRKSVYKHIKRIRTSIIDKGYFWQFFDLPSYIIMFIMIFGGALLRKSGLLPEHIMGPLYSGIGTALFSCGVRYIFAFFKKYVLSDEN